MADETPVNRGSRMECRECNTVWWQKVSDRCPACDPKYDRLRSTIRLQLENRRDEKRAIINKIEALEELHAMCERLDGGL